MKVNKIKTHELEKCYAISPSRAYPDCGGEGEQVPSV